MKPKATTGFLSPTFLFHLLVWLVYGVYNAMRLENYVEAKGVLFTSVPYLISVTLVLGLIYFNAFVLIPFLLDKKKLVLYFVALSFLVLLNTYLRSVVQQHWDTLIWPEESMAVSGYFKWNLFDSFWSLLISTLLLFSLRWTQQRQQMRSIEVTQLRTELKYLRSQLNPHFLFNGLNTIYAQIDDQNQDARDTLLKFSDLLRYSLYEADVDIVSLSREANYLENYISLQKARSNANLDIQLIIRLHDEHIKIAPLLFIPLVENAFKFTTREDGADNFVHVSLEQRDGQIEFNCSNSFDGPAPATGGIGLVNVVRRLELLYPGVHRLEVTKNNNVYSVRLLIYT